MQKDINDFLEYCSATAIESSLKKIKHKIVYIDKFYNGKLDNLNLKDLHRFLAHLNNTEYSTATKNDFIKVFKRFLKWKYEDWEKRFRKLQDARVNGNESRKLAKEDLLTADEMLMILNAVTDLRYKTFLILLQDTAARPEELLNLTWNNYSGSEVSLYSNKTKQTRTIPLDKSIEHLERYKEECFATPPEPTDKVFNFSLQTIYNVLHKVEGDLKFQKHLYPYLWRHSILSGMMGKLSPKVYEMYSGHSLATGTKTYVHLNTEDLRKELKEKVHKVKKLSKENEDRIAKLEEKIKEMQEQNKEVAKIIVKILNRTEKKV